MATMLKPIMKYASSYGKEDYQKLLKLQLAYEQDFGRIPIQTDVLIAKTNLDTLITLYNGTICNN